MDELVHEVEQGDDDPRVDVVDNEAPAQIERILQVEVLVLLTDEAGCEVVHVCELPIVLGADVEAHRDSLRGSLGVEFELQVLGSIVLDDVRVFLLLDGFAGQTSGREEVVGDEHGREELVLERDPAHAAIQCLIVARTARQVLGRVARIFVVHLRITAFEVASQLGAGQRLTPVHQHGAVVEHILDVLGLDAVVDQVALRTGQGIDEVELCAIRCLQAHGGRGVGHIKRLEIELVGVERTLRRVEGIVEVVVLLVEDHQRISLVVVILLQDSLFNLAAFGRNGKTDNLILQDDLLLRALHGIGQISVGLDKFHIVQAIQQGNRCAVLWCSLFLIQGVGCHAFCNLLDDRLGVGPGYRVIVATLCLNLLGCWLTDIHVPEEQGTHQKSSNYGVFIHTVIPHLSTSESLINVLCRGWAKKIRIIVTNCGRFPSSP